MKLHEIVASDVREQLKDAQEQRNYTIKRQLYFVERLYPLVAEMENKYPSSILDDVSTAAQETTDDNLNSIIPVKFGKGRWYVYPLDVGRLKGFNDRGLWETLMIPASDPKAQQAVQWMKDLNATTEILTNQNKLIKKCKSILKHIDVLQSHQDEYERKS